MPPSDSELIFARLVKTLVAAAARTSCLPVFLFPDTFTRKHFLLSSSPHTLYPKDSRIAASALSFAATCFLASVRSLSSLFFFA